MKHITLYFNSNNANGVNYNINDIVYSIVADGCDCITVLLDAKYTVSEVDTFIAKLCRVIEQNTGSSFQINKRETVYGGCFIDSNKKQIIQPITEITYDLVNSI